MTSRERRTPGVLQRLARRLPLILGLWIVISAPLIYLVHMTTEPTYEAFSTLRIEPSKPELFGPSVRGRIAPASSPISRPNAT